MQNARVLIQKRQLLEKEICDQVENELAMVIIIVILMIVR